ncbi:hypothetical protein KGD83_16770 [Nocardiopsis akebiae]|uniref:Aminoglycoside phosphotransferase n=2 Tax=Nocardiopsis TaxID=2013 RepID=A0ABX8BXT8_9ACTN|nr:hypothetical protein [Nocardiopsis akebiae]QUX27004.1 hypothetical protein KGD83_16770 [Nocardiopsis akebiae]
MTRGTRAERTSTLPFDTDAEKELLRGDALTHTDIHGHNFLIGAEGAWLVNWE